MGRLYPGRTASSNLKTVAGPYPRKDGNNLDLTTGNFVPQYGLLEFLPRKRIFPAVYPCFDCHGPLPPGDLLGAQKDSPQPPWKRWLRGALLNEGGG